MLNVDTDSVEMLDTQQADDIVIHSSNMLSQKGSQNPNMGTAI